MAGGLATVAGEALAISIFFGVLASHLLAASLMLAPAALAFSKLFHLEAKKPITEYLLVIIVY
jgi:CNT family concentrative nucleoside transporter